MNLPSLCTLPFRLGAAFLALVLAAPCACPAKPSLPDWLKTAMAQPLGDFGKDADAVQLVDWMNVTYFADGIHYTQYRAAVRIQNGDGARFANAQFRYIKGSDKVQELRAWLVLPGGEIREYKSKDFFNYESHDALFTEEWVQSLSLRDSARAGSVFAWTYVLREKNVFTDTSWFTREDCPILAADFTVAVPEGWKVRSIPVNNPEAKENFDGKYYTCHSRLQPGVKKEDLSPPDSTYPYFGITVLPPEAERARKGWLCFDDWNGVARSDVSMNDPQAAPDDAIRAKVTALTSGCATKWEKIRALAAFVQSVNYANFGKNLARGGGMKPNTAASVFAHNYGDCKDKTALLRAMLSCIGVEAYSVSCLLDTDNCVNPEFPSTGSFNHCITALRPPEDLDSLAIVDHPDLGRLLIFDPTNEITPVGFISEKLAHTYLLVGAGSCRGLVKFPDTGTNSKHAVTATIDERGTLSGTVLDTLGGFAADYERRACRNLSPAEYKHLIGESMRTQTRDTQILDATHEDDTANNRFIITVRFDAPGYARRIGASKFLFKVAPVYRYRFIPETQKEERKSPIILPRINLTEDVTVALADGLEVDELPADISVEEKFGKLKFSARAEGNTIHVLMEIQTSPETLPAADYGKFREFFKAYDKARQATLVVRKIAAK
jgi:hypothetical protein